MKEIYVEAKAWRDGLSNTIGLTAELDEGESMTSATKALRKNAMKLAQDGLQDKLDKKYSDRPEVK